MFVKIFSWFVLLYSVSASNILGFFAQPYRSQYVFVKPLFEELAKRGHNLTIYTMFTNTKSPPKIYSEIDIKHCLPTFDASRIDEAVNPTSVFQLLSIFKSAIPKSKNILQCAPIAELIDSNDRYDLLLTGILHNDWYVGFAYKFDVPMINVFANTLLPWFVDTIGGITNPSYVPNLMNSDTEMNFFQRINNLYLYVMMKIFGNFYLIEPSQVVANEIFGDDVPLLKEIVKNTSVTLYNAHFTRNKPMPLVPSLIQVGGMNVLDAKKLPEVGIQHIIC